VILPCTPQSDTNRLRPRTTAGWRWGVTRNVAPRLADCNFTVRRDKSFADDLVERPGRVRSRVALLLRATERKPDAALICTTGCGACGDRGKGPFEDPGGGPRARGRVTRRRRRARPRPPKAKGASYGRDPLARCPLRVAWGATPQVPPGVGSRPGNRRAVGLGRGRTFVLDTGRVTALDRSRPASAG
jgi:hypothetical protein